MRNEKLVRNGYFSSKISHLIMRCIRLEMPNPLSDSHTSKDQVMPSLKKIRCVTREEKLFQTRVRCLQHSSLSRAPSTPTPAEHLTLARNSSFFPLVVQCVTNGYTRIKSPFRTCIENNYFHSYKIYFN